MNKLNAKKVGEVMTVVGDFIAANDIDSACVVPLLNRMEHYKLEPTKDNLAKVWSEMLNDYYEKYPSEKPEVSDAEFRALVDKMGSDEYVKKIKSDPAFKQRVDDMK